MFKAEVVLDSVSPMGNRLTTLLCTYPRFILAEMNTHRCFSRNTASSRAIPVEKMIKQVKENPFIPSEWPANKPGMQASEYVLPLRAKQAAGDWLAARDAALLHVGDMVQRGVHKQIVNRLLEPFSWTTQLISSTEWDNFFKLRCSPEAQPEMQKIANIMKQSIDNSKPGKLNYSDWHMPLLEKEDLSDLLDEYYSNLDKTEETLKKVSVARCARLSYLTHEGKRDIDKDLALYEKLLSSGHLSPFEHVATPSEFNNGNFIGWQQLRWDLDHE